MAKTYKVTGTQPIFDHQPGETFTAAFPADREAFLLAIGGIAVVEDKKPSKKPRVFKGADDR